MKIMKVKQRTCKNKGCNNKYPQYNSIQTWCSPKCGAEIAQAKVKANYKAETIVLRNKYYANDIKTREKAAHDYCHLWIKIRDKGLLCICCNLPIGEQGNAGHFHESGNNSRIRYDEDNIHYQRIYCNMYKGGDSDDYRGNLIKKIGIDRVERLDSLKGGTVKRTCEDYKTIENYYKDKIKHHKQQIGD
jgi:hypothetical protein